MQSIKDIIFELEYILFYTGDAINFIECYNFMLESEIVQENIKKAIIYARGILESLGDGIVENLVKEFVSDILTKLEKAKNDVNSLYDAYFKVKDLVIDLKELDKVLDKIATKKLY